MKNVLKISFLGILGILLLTYLTAEKPAALNANDSISKSIAYATLPADYELVGKENRVTKESLFKQGQKSLIIVGNHDSLAIVKDLPKYYEVNMPYIMVANISSAPWFVKKMFIPGKLKELNEGSSIPMVYDFDGDMVKALQVTDTAKTKFTAFIIDESGAVAQVYSGNVKEGALDGSMSEAEIKAVLLPISKLIQ